MTTWPVKSKTFTIWPLKKLFANPIQKNEVDVVRLTVLRLYREKQNPNDDLCNSYYIVTVISIICKMLCLQKCIPTQTELTAVTYLKKRRAGVGAEE